MFALENLPIYTRPGGGEHPIIEYLSTQVKTLTLSILTALYTVVAKVGSLAYNSKFFAAQFVLDELLPIVR